VTCSLDLVLYTGDIDYAKTYYPSLIFLLEHYYSWNTNTSSGLLSKGIKANSAGYGDYAFIPRTGEVTYYNALYVAALRAGAQLSEIVDRQDSYARRWTERADLVADAINKKLWDEEAGAYINSPQDASTTFGQDGNSLAVLHGIAPASRATKALAYLDTFHRQPYGNVFFNNDVLGQNFSKRVYGFTSYFEISARFVAGQADSAIEEIKRLYGWMATHDPGITMWEGIGPTGSQYEGPYTSDAHGWSTGVLPALSNYVLGVMPTGPGFKTFTVKPYTPANVTWAQGQVPTPYGHISVKWLKDESGFHMNVTTPKGTEATVSVPVRSPDDRASVNGATAWYRREGVMRDAAYSNGWVSIAVAGGFSYTFDVWH